MAPPVTVTQIKSHLVGLENWLQAAATCRERYDDTAIAARIPAIIRQWERKTQYRVEPCQIVSAFDDGVYSGANLPAGYRQLQEDGYTYMRQMAQEYFSIILRQRPVVSVDRVRVVIGTSLVFAMPVNWYIVETKAARFSIQPVYGPLLISSLNAFSALEFQFGPKDYLANCIRIDYKAGLPAGWESDPEWADLALNLQKSCAVQVMKDISEMADAGLISVSVSGANSTESYNYSRFKERIERMEADVESFTQDFRDVETPILMGCL